MSEIDSEVDIARSFWNRVDSIRGKIQLADLADRCKMSFTTIRNQKSGSTPKLPKTLHVVALARELGTTVEYLVTGERTGSDCYRSFYDAYAKADEASKQIVRIALKLDQKEIEDQVIA